MSTSSNTSSNTEFDIVNSILRLRLQAQLNKKLNTSQIINALIDDILKDKNICYKTSKMKKILTGDISKLLSYDSNLNNEIASLKRKYGNNYIQMIKDKSWKKIVNYLNRRLFMSLM